MAFLLVPLATVRAALKIDDGESDTWLSLLVSAASRAVLRYLKLPFDFSATGDSPADSPPNSPPDDLTLVDERVQLAVIALVGFYYDFDRVEALRLLAAGEMPSFVTALIYSERTPTLA